MASAEDRRTTSQESRLRAIPAQRTASEDEQIRADDRLIEALRTGQPVDDADPVARMLAAWRTEVMRGA